MKISTIRSHILVAAILLAMSACCTSASAQSSSPGVEDGPRATLIGTIAKFAVTPAIVAPLVGDYVRSTGNPPSFGVIFDIRVALRELSNSYNNPPPTSFSDATFSVFKSSKEYRSYISFIPEFTTNDSGMFQDFSLKESDISNGYTPIRIFGYTIKYSPGTGSGVPVISGIPSDTVTVTWHHKCQIGPLGRLVNFILIGQPAPTAWQEIKYTFSTDGTYDIVFSASNFPTATAYINYQQVAVSPQTGLVQFIESGSQEEAPGGEFYETSGQVP